jgi:hypothetical protein
MNNSLLQYAYLQYAIDTPHEKIIQGLIGNGANPTEAQQILDVATITFCTKSSQVSQPSEPATEEGMGAGEIFKIIIGIIGLMISLVKCMN